MHQQATKGRSYYDHRTSCVYVKAYAYCMPLHLCKQLVIGFGPGGAPAAAAASGRLASIALKLRPKLVRLLVQPIWWSF